MFNKKSRSLKLVTICLLLISAMPGLLHAQRNPTGPRIKIGIWKNHTVQYVAGQIAVKLNSNSRLKDIGQLISRFKAKVVRDFDQLGWGLIEVPSDTDIFQVIANMSTSPAVKTLEPNQVFRLLSVPDDPHFGLQWGLLNTGSNSDGGAAGADVDATDAWDITTGNPNILIGVLDTGIPIVPGSTTQLSHPDLSDASRILLGPNETSDGLGVRDSNGHGTNVAGIIGAETNNGIGVAGVAGNCKLLIVKVFHPADVPGGAQGTSDEFYHGVVDAITDGARVLNFSGGSPYPDAETEDAISYANSMSVLIVAAAGNDGPVPQGQSDVYYPAAYSTQYDNVICVSATNNSDQIAEFSSTGPEVTVSAPGGTTGPNQSSYNIYSTEPNYPYYFETKDGYPENYAYLRGTSQAAPFVAGIAGLILSVNPNLNPSRVRTILENSSKDLGPSGFDDDYGYGRVNAYQALKYTLENYGGTISQTLTIPQGDSWNFQPNTLLTVNGGLNGNGVTFTGSSGTWSGITFASSSSGNLQNCTISYAISPIVIDTANVTISGCTINNSSFYGGNSSTAAAIQVWDSSPTITNTQIDGESDSWSGVRFAEGSGGTLSGCTIQNLGAGHGVIVQGGSNPTISHNVLRNNHYHGVICSNDGTAEASINSNTATGNGDGFAIYSSYSLLQENTSSGNFCGIYAQDGSTITSGGINQKGANIITSNTWGINATNSSTFTFGGWTGRYYMGTCNEIYGNTTWDVISAGSSDISAGYDWWGQYPPNTSKFNVDGSSYFYYDNALMAPEDCPLGPVSPIAQKAASPNSGVSSPPVSSDTSQDNPASLFAFAEGAQMDGDYEIAAATYRSLLKDTISTGDKDRALVRLFNVFQASRDTTIIADLQSISQSSGELAQRSRMLLGYAYEATHQTMKAEAALNDVVSKYPGTESEKKALILLASMRYFDPTADKVSSAALAELIEEYGSTLDKGELLALGSGNDAPRQAAKLAAKPDAQAKSDTSSISLTVSLGNYPNPFNPTTLIKYQITRDTHITLKVYDILGREVATLVDGVESAGHHEVTFDGSKFASGVYFYRLTTPTYSKLMKMLMIK